MRIPPPLLIRMAQGRTHTVINVLRNALADAVPARNLCLRDHGTSSNANIGMVTIARICVMATKQLASSTLDP